MARNDHSDNAHQSTYARFTNVTKWGSIVIACVLLALYIFLV
jgi:hypothetical protein